MAKPNEIAGKHDATGTPKAAGAKEVELPTATDLSPKSVDGEIELVITGTGFTDKAVICFNGIDLPTTFVSETEVRAKGRPPGIGSYPVQVKIGEVATAPLTFEVKAFDVAPVKDAKASPHGKAESAPSKAEKENHKTSER